ncbi:MAG: AEC family transporter [Kangiellaceae bacterium]|jgi:predicted permease|nr:AEC family transporter [Kangiellaceae bacterium]
MENFVLTISFLLIGMVIRRISDFSDETGNVLNLFVIYISLPALVLLNIPKLTFSSDLFVPALMPWLMLLLSFTVILAISKLLNWNRSTTGCLLLVIPLGNTSFLGIPMVQAFFGDSGVPYALLYDQLGSFLALATYGSLIIAIYGKTDTKPTINSVIKKVVTFPPFIALVIALLIRTITYPPIATSLLEVLASTLVPLVMIAVGFQLTLRLNKEVLSQLSIGLSIKLIAAPIAALFLCKLAGLNGQAVQVAIFEAGMPPMISAGALAILAKLSPKLAAAVVGIGIIASFTTLPLLYQIIVG